MAITMHAASVPIFTAMLRNLHFILGKAEAHAEARKFDPAALLEARLAPDMLPFLRQVPIACDAAKNGVARLAGIEPPRFEDTERTFPELKARIDKTIAWLESVTPVQMDGAETREVTFPSGRETTRTLPGQPYLQRVVLPNFFFHVTTAYALLRHNGVEIGKGDYLAGSGPR